MLGWTAAAPTGFARSWTGWRAIALVVAAVLAAHAAPAATLVDLPDDVVGEPGDTLDVCLSIDPLDDMLAADIDVVYDETVLNALDAQKTDLVDDFTLTTNLSEPGWVRLSLFGTEATTGGGCVVTITFELLRPGCSLLHIARALINEGEIPSETDEGLVSVQQTEDLDGDGYTPQQGDCSEYFDWIHPGGTERCNGADDDCDGSFDEDVVCPCGSFVTPREVPFWQRVCRGASVEGSIEPEYVDLVNDYATFADVTTEEDICAVMLPGAGDDCVRAETEFMALLLDVASDRLCREQPIEATSTDALDVNEALDEIDELLVSPSRTPADCQQAAAIASEISSGAAIPEFLAEEFAVQLARQHDSGGTLEAIALSWSQPDAAAAGRPLTYGVHRSTVPNAGWSVIGGSGCHLWYPDLDGADATPPELHYQVAPASP